MYKFVCVLLLSLHAVVGASAQKACYNKMSSMVRRIALEHGVGEHDGQRRAPEVSGSEPTLCAFVRLSGNADSTFRANGCRALARFGDIYIADIPLSSVGSLSASPNVSRIEAGQSKHVLLDSVATQVNAERVYAADALPQAYTGSGVVMGLQDVGFDVTHPNFYNADGTQYRIKRFWDQLSADTLGSELYVGADYQSESDILAYQHSRDGLTQTHGTHTLGIAAGSGAGYKYRGLAYESDICIVSNAVSSDLIYIRDEDIYKYTYATDALGFKYIFDYAEQEGKPCVISFSEGSLQDFRGDDVLYYEVLSQLVGPGRIIVSSAGNTGFLKNYMQKPQGQPSAGTFMCNAGGTSIGFTVKSDKHFELRMVVYGADNDTLTLHTGDIVAATDSTLTVTMTMCGDEYEATAVAYTSCYDDSQTAYDVLLSGPKNIGVAAPLSVELVGEPEIDFFRMSGVLCESAYNPLLCDGDCSHGINSPSSAPCVICVGATAYRSSYVNEKGNVVSADWGSGGDVATFSSQGPTFDGRTKPDVLAPGANVVSSESSFYIENNPDDCDNIVQTFVHGGRRYGWMSEGGTSMSSPVVGGIVALWLQANPQLSPQDVLGVIERTSSRYESMKSVPDNRYGYGQIDAYKGLLDILGISGISHISQSQPAGVTFRLSGTTLHMGLASEATRGFTLGIYATNGALQQRIGLPSGSTEYHIDMSSLRKGVYVIQLDGLDGRTCGSTLVRL